MSELPVAALLMCLVRDVGEAVAGYPIKGSAWAPTVVLAGAVETDLGDRRPTV